MRSALGRYTTRSGLQSPCRRRRTTQRQGRSLDATVALGSRPAPDVIQPAWPHQAASSRATLAGGAARAAKLGIFTVAPPAVARTSATRHVVARLSVETHVHRAAARRLPSRLEASQRRVSGDNTPGRRCMGGCAGGAVLKKIAARFSFRGLRARKDTIAHATESHGVIRASVAVARRTGTQRACSVRAVRERVTSLLRRAFTSRLQPRRCKKAGGTAQPRLR